MSQRSPFGRGSGGGGGGVEPQGGEPRDQSARMILIGVGVVGLILLILILPPLSLLSGGGGGSNPGTNGATMNEDGSTTVRLPRVPDGYEALSQLYTEQDAKVGGRSGPFVVSLSLVQATTDARNIGIYTYRSGEWVRLANAALQAGGTEVRGQIDQMPANLAVLRRSTAAIQVSGWLPSDAQVDGEALQAMTTVNTLGFVPVADGNVAGGGAAPPAGQHNVIPTVRATSPEEIEAVNAILASPQLQEAHVNALVQLSLQPGNAGVDLDYRNVNPARKADLTAFVQTLAQQLRQNSRSLTLTLPTPAKAGVSWDTGAYDWEALAREVDMIKLVGEPDPSVYFQRMQEVFAYLDPKIDMKKVSLVLTTRSIEKGTDGLVSMSLFDALSLASTIELRTTAQIVPGTSVAIVGKNIYQDDGATGISWDQGAYAVTFAYPGRGGQRTIWMENSLSLAFKLDMVRRNNLGGVAFENIAEDPGAPDVWNLVSGFAESGTVSLVAPNSVMLRPTWQAQAGSTDQGQKGNIVWRAPAQPGAYDITLTVSDGVIRAQQKVVLQVNEASTNGSTAQPTATPQP